MSEHSEAEKTEQAEAEKKAAEKRTLAKYDGSRFPYSDKDVAQYVSDLGKLAGEMKFVVGAPYDFGLALDVYDPVSGHIISVVRPRRRDIGVEEIILSLDQVAAEVANARVTRVNEDRAHGIVTPEEQERLTKQGIAAREADKKLGAEKAAAKAA